MLIVFSSPKKVNHEISLIIRLFEEGLKYFHLRKPEFTNKEMADYLDNIPKTFHNRIVIHSCFNLLQFYNLKGINLKFTEINSISDIYKTNSITVSCHKQDELLKLNRTIEYAFLSPVFDSISKEGYKGRHNPVIISEFFRTHTLNTKIIALGGINDKNAPFAIKAGFDGVAVLGYIWKNFEETGNIYHAVKKYRKLYKCYTLKLYETSICT